LKKPFAEEGLAEWLKVVGLEFKPYYCKKKPNKLLIPCTTLLNVLIM
jgi:hypothetical protein